MALGMEVGIGLGHIVLDGNAAPLPQKRDRAPNFWPISPFLLCQTAGCIKILLGMEVGLSPGDFVLDRDPAPKFSAHVYYSYCDFVRTLHSAQCTVIALFKFKFKF